MKAFANGGSRSGSGRSRDRSAPRLTPFETHPRRVEGEFRCDAGPAGCESDADPAGCEGDADPAGGRGPYAPAIGGWPRSIPWISNRAPPSTDSVAATVQPCAVAIS